MTVVHEGGASAERSTLAPVLAASRVRFARKHRGAVAAGLERAGIALADGIRGVGGARREAVTAAPKRALS